MSTYAIGDVQGCYEPLMRLLEHINYAEDSDALWFTGDLVNRGPESAKTVRFIKSLKNCVSVLGNHDLGVLAIARGAEPYLPEEHTFADLLEAEDREELLQFMEQLPLLHHDDKLGYTLVHAGFHPAWDLSMARKLASEIEAVLRSNNGSIRKIGNSSNSGNDNSDNNVNRLGFYQHLYGNAPDTWNETLTGFDRLRFIVNCFTRMRFVSPEGKLDLATKGTIETSPQGFMPWYKVPNRKSKNLKILFGHWAALNGKTDEKNVFALDTGCAWGASLTAMRLEDGQRFQVGCGNDFIQFINDSPFNSAK